MHLLIMTLVTGIKVRFPVSYGFALNSRYGVTGEIGRGLNRVNGIFTVSNLSRGR